MNTPSNNNYIEFFSERKLMTFIHIGWAEPTGQADPCPLLSPTNSIPFKVWIGDVLSHTIISPLLSYLYTKLDLHQTMQLLKT